MKIHTVNFNPENWMELVQQLGQLDRFDAKWQAIERREKQTLKELKSIATVRSIGASTRIEGSRLTDKEVEILIDNLDISKLSERDQQEVAGYYEALNLIGESNADITISEGSIRQLHNMLMKYGDKDQYHRGNYKVTPNRVERTEADGTKTPVFETAAPGWPTQDAMAGLLEWYNSDSKTHPLIKAAVFVYEFLSIHPFQDGNGRLSRLLATLLLLKSSYVWIEYVSFEHEIEHRKKEYYKTLMNAQRQRPGEEVVEWVSFFLDCLKNIQAQLLEKVKEKEKRENIGMREQLVYSIVENNPGISSGEIAERANVPPSTVKRILSDLVAGRNLIVHGAGRATSYSIAATGLVKRDVGLRFTNEERVKDFTLPQLGAFFQIKKIVLTPLFEWEHPEEWSRRLSQNGLYLSIQAVTAKAIVVMQHYAVSTYNDPHYFQPVFIVTPNIVLPDSLIEKGVSKIDFPVRCSITLSGSIEHFDFDVMLVTDQG
jgi:Fic family protein